MLEFIKIKGMTDDYRQYTRQDRNSIVSINNKTQLSQRITQCQSSTKLLRTPLKWISSLFPTLY